MGNKVLDAGPTEPGFHLYAHCTPDRRGAVTMLAINNVAHDRNLQSRHRAGLRAVSNALETAEVRLNGQVLKLDVNDELPAIKPIRTAGERPIIDVEARSISLSCIPAVDNVACR
ncbi:MAG: hypothetical protein R3D89_12950 [Sphingomonadaceae bacterium]